MVGERTGSILLRPITDYFDDDDDDDDDDDEDDDRKFSEKV
jgi:hypothetical protein